MADGNEEIELIKKKKELDFGFGPKNNQNVVPAEIIKTKDDLVIKNFEVDFEEEAPDVRMIGGIRGIKALRVHREYIPDVEVDHQKMENPFHRYDELKKI